MWTSEIDPFEQISEHFIIHDLIWLPQYGRLADESDGLDAAIMANLEQLAFTMDDVWDFFNAKINVHCAYRPLKYNELVGGAKNSAHLTGEAMDFDVTGMSCDNARALILKLDRLNKWGTRMEQRPLSSWVHIDVRPVPPGGHRYFLP